MIHHNILPRAASPSAFDEALSTTFTPAQTCTEEIYLVEDALAECNRQPSDPPCRYFHLGPSTSSADCMPTGWVQGSMGYFTPGLCPRGYTQACSKVRGGESGVETIATCCPSRYKCQTDADLPWYTTEPCVLELGTEIPLTYTFKGEGGTFVTRTATNTWHGINAFAIEIRYRSEDFAKSTASTETATTTSDITASASSSDASSSSSGSGLSTGAKAGIGVGVGAFVLIALGVAFFLFKRRQKRSEVLPPPEENKTPVQSPPYPPAELHPWGISELGSNTSPNQNYQQPIPSYR